MYSIVIPTMWKQHLGRFREVLVDLNNSSLVNEIILIDNDSSSCPTEMLTDLSKLQYNKQIENIYVNPAWNLGVDISTSEYVMILNDDVWCNPSIPHILTAHQSHADKENGIYGLSTSCFLCEDMITDVHNTEIQVVNTEGRGTGWGCLFMFKRDRWTPIPNELKVWFGDDFITREFTKRSDVVYSIKNVCVTEWSITSRLPEFTPITENDKEIYFSKYSN